MSDYKETNCNPIIFIHIPKTAGTSFRNAVDKKNLRAVYDYGKDNPVTSNIINDSIYNNDKQLLFNYIVKNDIQFCGGHNIDVSDYLGMLPSEACFCTFFREPVQRVIADYKHFVRHKNYQDSIEVFCTTPVFCNRQYKRIQGLDLESFYFFGITEDYRASLSIFNTLSGLNLPYIEANVGRKSLDEAWETDNSILELIRSCNQKDILLYEKAKKLFYEKWGNKTESNEQLRFRSILLTVLKRHCPEVTKLFIS